ncbi:MAG: hypothetical protein H7X84_01610 [Verrucomicrobia bacterium]|nr:hypothetical protein [Prolixibacteraceae bacterium]
MKDLRIVCWTFLLSLTLNSCNLDELDFNKLSNNVNLNPEVVVPIAKGNIAVWDLVNAANKDNVTGLEKDPNGLVKIVYRQNNLFTYSANNLLDFPVTQNFSSGDQQLGDISPADVRISRDLSLNMLVDNLGGTMNVLKLLNGQTVLFPPLSLTGLNSQFVLDEFSEFTTVNVTKGTLEIHLANYLKVPVTIKGTLYDKLYNRTVADFTFLNLAPGATKNILADLAGMELSNQVEFRMLTFETPGSATPVPINLQDYIQVKFKLTGLVISKGNLKISNSQTLDGSKGDFDFDFPQPDMKAFGAVLKKGTLSLKCVNTSALSGSVNVTLPEIKNKTTGNPITAVVPLNGTQTVISLDEAVVNFASDAANPFNKVPYTYTLTVNQTPGYINYSSTDAIKVDMSLSNLEFKSVTGDFGKRNIIISPGSFDIDVDMLNKINGGFTLINPSLILAVRNSMGIPAAVSFDFVASDKNGTTVSLDPPVFDIPLPADVNAAAVTKNIVFDKQNSHIVDLVALPPTGRITYRGKVDLNLGNAVTAANPNFLDIEDILGIDLLMELPLELQISNLGFKDTTRISGSDFDQVETAELTLNAKNGIPLDIELQLLFVDTISKQQYGASKVSKVLSAAQVSESGEITPFQASHTFSLDKTELESLKKANGLVFSGKVSSPASGSKVARIFSDSKIEMNLVLKSKVNL